MERTDIQDGQEIWAYVVGLVNSVVRHFYFAHIVFRKELQMRGTL